MGLRSIRIFEKDLGLLRVTMRRAKEKISAQYLRRDDKALSAPHHIASTDPENNVQAVGVGYKISGGKRTGELAVKIYVARKFAKDEIRDGDRLPEAIDGIVTDVEESGLFFRQSAVAPPAPPLLAPIDPKVRLRPAQPGCSIGFADPDGRFVMAGTFGALVKKNGRQYILSNNHVLADENRLKPGAAIYQPGLLDGGDPALDQIASLSEFVPLSVGGANTVDCAIAEVTDPKLVSDDILAIGTPDGFGPATSAMTVEKFGRTTSYTAGHVSSIDADVKIRYDIGTLVFTNQLLIEGLDGAPFSAAGDSGSLIVERGTHLAVGLLFAGSGSHTIANHLTDVMGALDIELA